VLATRANWPTACDATYFNPLWHVSTRCGTSPDRATAGEVPRSMVGDRRPSVEAVARSGDRATTRAVGLQGAKGCRLCFTRTKGIAGQGVMLCRLSLRESSATFAERKATVIDCLLLKHNLRGSVNPARSDPYFPLSDDSGVAPRISESSSFTRCPAPSKFLRLWSIALQQGVPFLPEQPLAIDLAAFGQCACHKPLNLLRVLGELGVQFSNCFQFRRQDALFVLFDVPLEDRLRQAAL